MQFRVYSGVMQSRQVMGRTLTYGESRRLILIMMQVSVRHMHFLRYSLSRDSDIARCTEIMIRRVEITISKPVGIVRMLIVRIMRMSSKRSGSYIASSFRKQGIM
jgi:hypothetical protein